MAALSVLDCGVPAEAQAQELLLTDSRAEKVINALQGQLWIDKETLSILHTQQLSHATRRLKAPSPENLTSRWMCVWAV
jgi:hypothetical protein